MAVKAWAAFSRSPPRPHPPGAAARARTAFAFAMCRRSRARSSAHPPGRAWKAKKWLQHHYTNVHELIPLAHADRPPQYYRITCGCAPWRRAVSVQAACRSENHRGDSGQDQWPPEIVLNWITRTGNWGMPQHLFRQPAHAHPQPWQPRVGVGNERQKSRIVDND